MGHSVTEHPHVERSTPFRAKPPSGGPDPAAKLGLDETIEVPVEDPIDVAELNTRPMVLHHPIRMEHVRADLGSEVDPALLAAQVLDALLPLPAHALGQPGLEDPHGQGA